LIFSVIVPTRNRSMPLIDLLNSLAEQEAVPLEWEVIVVDNGSTDNTFEVVKQMMITSPLDIRYVYEAKVGLHHARHRGAVEARGEFLGYLDDDMILTPTWIQGVEMLAERKAQAVVGRILPRWEAKVPDWLEMMNKNGVLGYLGLLNLGEDRIRIDSCLVFGGNCFLPKHLLFDLGGFHPDGMPLELIRYRGDGETALMKRFAEGKHVAYYDPRATVYHIIPAERMTIEYFCRRAYNQGISNSFTHVRALHFCTNIGSTHGAKKGVGHYLRRLSEMRIKDLIKIIANRLRVIIYFMNRRPYKHIYAQINAAFQAGWEFHQNEVRRDPELLKYVLKDTYFD
jgi:glycosyltransferase involved in cell wall biosynthesis